MARTQLPTQLPPAMKEALGSIIAYHTDQFERLAEAEQKRSTPKAPTLNPASLMMDLSRQNLNGENVEVLKEGCRRDKVVFDPVRPYLSFRDLTVAVASGGGYLKGTEVQDSIDILRPWSVMARAGITIEFGLVGDSVVPKVTAKSTPSWLTTESSQAPESIPTLAQIPLTPKNAAGFLEYSRHFSKQANAPSFVARELLRTVGGSIDQAILNGSGSNGQPLGLIGTTGVQTQLGATLNAGCATMKRKSAEANVNDEGISFLSTPAVRELLEGREKATGGGKFVWDKDQVADRPAYVSTDMPTATMIAGDFSLVYLGIWGSGLFLELNPFDTTGFKQGLIQARVIVSCDVAVLHPSAFIVASSIT